MQSLEQTDSYRRKGKNCAWSCSISSVTAAHPTPKAQLGREKQEKRKKNRHFKNGFTGKQYYW